MNQLTTKQKIIIGGVIGVMLVIIAIYGYSMTKQDDNWEESALEVDENLQNEVASQENGEVNNSLENKKDATEINSSQKQENSIPSAVENQVNGYENLQGKIVVHITGSVQKTGILVLPEGARIADAIDASRRFNGKR